MKIDGQEVHASLTLTKVMKAAKKAMTSTANPAYCIACGKACSDDPDAAKDTCKKCGKPAVYGIDNLVMYFC
jgi:rRNA maturation endonuclease Nob1